ncbi:DGQHR domain-containing protein [Gordonia sp. zg691]|uniref:DNA sulfur modification protein DndB n=1 Tax=Gordonia jinghuaiqii TaxID=2758710 RepID=UPI0016622EC4|nr:DNA sulfur modification protein DndB [Gordonia jinghuaiqii]MBD0862458.1 DGQHR domain-containing protein [Gordonia jinghuaiqii]
MGTKTFIPAFQATVGDWKYYMCVMKYAQVANNVNFAHEMGGNKDLNSLIQRGISSRTEDIEEYLLKSSHRFLGSLIVACWGGQPEYIELQMDDPDGYLKGVDSGFGVLTFDGSQQYFALDGQHRLTAIKSAVKRDPALGAEEICVLLVSHYNTTEGRERTQRLFTNINRNAKTTTKSENIALDVDDTFAVITRRLLTEHEFLRDTGRVRVFTKPPTDGDFSLAGASVPVTDPKAWTTIGILYSMLKHLGYGLPKEAFDEATRPSEDVLELAYKTLTSRVDDLLHYCGQIQEKLENTSDARALRSPKNKEGTGHAFMRPVVQETVCRAIESILDQQTLSWDDTMSRLSELDWTIGRGIWLSVFNPTAGRMMTGKEYKDLLFQLLVAHLAPTSKSEIKRAREQFKAIIQKTYPVSQEEMEKAIVS